MRKVIANKIIEMANRVDNTIEVKVDDTHGSAMLIEIFDHKTKFVTCVGIGYKQVSVMQDRFGTTPTIIEYANPKFFTLVEAALIVHLDNLDDPKYQVAREEVNPSYKDVAKWMVTPEI